MAEDKNVKLQRRKAMKRKNFIRGDQSSTLTRITEPDTYTDSSDEEDDTEHTTGSSIDLTPTLLGIYDQIASSNQNGDSNKLDQSDFDYFLANEKLEDGSDDQCHSPKSSPPLQRNNQSKFRELIDPTMSERGDLDNNKNFKSRLRMENSESNDPNLDLDNKKRPLSISSMSSSSTSSLQRRRKRPNLSQCSESNTSSQLDIEKLDNLLYIDDIPDETQDRSADELSVCSEDKRKSGGDSDSQVSAEQTNDTLQSESIGHSISFHQSDSSLSYTPSNSTNCSTADLSLNADLKSCDASADKVRRSPSRSSQKSSGRSGSLKQAGHYVSFVQRVVTELVETERIYVKHLHDIKQGYYKHITDIPGLKMSTVDVDCLFGNIVEIYDFSCIFLNALEDCGMDPIKVAECFVKNSDGFVIYAEYCTNYPSAVAVLTKVMCDPQLSDVFKQRQISLGHSLPLGAYLLKPVQRVLKYHLLLQNILKNYDKSDPGHDKLLAALEHMTDMSHQINEMKRKHEHAVRVQEIQSQLEDYEGEDFTRLGELVLEGSFRMFGVKASRQMFLFEKGIIIAKRKEDGMLTCKAFIPCAKLMLVESIPKEPLNFQIVPFDNPKGAFTIHARNLDQKRKWCQEIKTLILESFSSKIPDNVKDLIIEKLGKTKEEDNLAHFGSSDTSKSHVTTPDYLEKRLRARRKSGPALIPDLLRQRGKKAHQGKNRMESPSSKSSLENININKNSSRTTANEPDQFGFRQAISPFSRGNKANKRDNQENRSPNQGGPKRPVSVQRSQSFQNSIRNSHPMENYLKDKSNTDSLSVDNLSQSEGPAIRTNSFRMATRISPIRFDNVDGSLKQSEQNNESVQSTESQESNSDLLRPSVRKSIADIDIVDAATDKTNNARDSRVNAMQNLNGSFLSELSSQKRGRYASMPVLNTTPPSSPKVSRLCSESSYSPNKVSSPKLTVHYAKRIDIQPFFSYSRDRLNQISSNNSTPSSDKYQGLTKDQFRVNALNDTFVNIRKSQENVFEKDSGSKQLSLTQPKPFNSTLKHSANILQSKAKLNKWGEERFTKGSMSDVSHLQEDPWVPNKHRSYTESHVTLDGHRTDKQTTSTPLHSPTKLQNRQVGRLNIENLESRHLRTQSFNGDDGTVSREIPDWVVYANRNSLPVSGFAGEEISRKYKYCTPPRGSMEPPPSSKDSVSDLAKTPVHQNVVSTFSSTPRQGQGHSTNGYLRESDISAGDSTISLSATTSSSETCSSPDILKDGVFDDMNSADKIFPRDRSQLSRSFSSPEPKSKFRRQIQEDRPASADVLGDINTIEESEKLVAEMERYLKRSTSSSGSLSSSNSKFPTSIPNFEKKTEHRNRNRDSCLSSGSASSYESNGDLSTAHHNEEGLVDHIKNKISNITNKLTGKKSSDMSTCSESPSSSNLSRYKQENHPTKLGHQFSLRLKTDPKTSEPDLPSLLREMEPGSQAIGSRMANTDLDDYATFSLPRAQDNQPSGTKSSQEPRRLHYGRFSNSNLTGPKLHNIPGTHDKPKYKSESKLATSAVSVKNLNVAQSDSAFSIQSVESSSTEDSPRDNDTRTGKNSAKSSDENENNEAFYERRFSAVFNNDEAFRDSAVYCDDVDTPPVKSPSENPVSPNLNIRNYIQQLEEKNKPKELPPQKVASKEPGAIIRQRMESLIANSDRTRSSSASRSMSSTTSRTQSRCSSRASSEEKQVQGAALRDYIDSKFPRSVSEVDQDDYGFRSNSERYGGGLLKPAFSMGRLDTLSMDVDNLVIMKGWVRELIEKFQSSN
ncbi:Pleckstrin y domain-containing G member 1 [Mactra antiquata]